MPRHISFDAVRPGMVFAERYFVVRPIKAGGMGAVFEVQHTRTHKPHALKVMHPDVVAKKGAREKFEQEAYIGARIQSSHVVDVMDAGVDEATGLPYLVMELLVGSELAAMVEREKRVEPTRLIGYLQQVARALDKAHARGIIHRDLKPENIFITKTEDGRPFVKVLDFGIAKIVEGATREGTDETGTPLYMAPEQTARGQLIGAATDIWALAIVAYECLVGVTYWRAGSVAEFYRELLFEDFASAEQRAKEDGVDLPRGFDQWFFGCIDREPTKRFKTAGEAVSTLAAVFGVELSSATRSGPHPAIETSGEISKAPSRSGEASAARDLEMANAPTLSLDDREVAEFSNKKKRNIAIVIAVLLIGAIGAAVVMARQNAWTPPPETSASTSSSSVAAPIDTGPPKTINEAIRNARPRKLACYDAGRKRKPKLAGKVVIEFKLGDAGDVTEAKVTESTLDDAQTAGCLLEVVKSLKIAPPPKDAPRVMTDTTELG